MDYLSIFMPLQDNCYGDAAGFQVKIKSKVDEQKEMRLKNTDWSSWARSMFG